MFLKENSERDKGLGSAPSQKYHALSGIHHGIRGLPLARN